MLLRGLRRLAGLVGFLSMTLHVIWIPTEFNPADIFSRVQGIIAGTIPRAVGWNKALFHFLDTFRVVTGSFLEMTSGPPVLTDGHSLAGIATSTALGFHLSPRFDHRDPAQWEFLLRVLDWKKVGHFHVQLASRLFGTRRGARGAIGQSSANDLWEQRLLSLAEVVTARDGEFSIGTADSNNFWDAAVVSTLLAWGIFGTVRLSLCRWGSASRSDLKILSSAWWLGGLGGRCLRLH